MAKVKKEYKEQVQAVTFVETLKEAPRPALAPIDYQPEHQDQSSEGEGQGQSGDGDGDEEKQGQGQGQSGENQGEGEESDGDQGDGDDSDDDDEGEKQKNPSILVKEDLALTSVRSHYCNLQEIYSEDEIEKQKEIYYSDRESFVEAFRHMVDRFGRDRITDSIAYLGLMEYTHRGIPLGNVLTRRDIESVIGGKISDVCATRYKHEDEPEDIGFSLQLRSVMTDNKFDRMLSGRRRGTLDGNMLYKVPTGDLKAFKNREARQNKDYHFTLLVDQSGSMEGDSCLEAAKLGVSLYKAFERSGISYSCYGYSDHTARYKSFDDHLDPDALYAMLRYNASDNNEYPALVDAFSRFPSAKRSNNFVILLSDGGIRPSQQSKMKEFVRNHGRIATLIGIGVGRGRDEMPFCDIDIQRNTVPEAKMELLRQLRNVIRRG